MNEMTDRLEQDLNEAKEARRLKSAFLDDFFEYKDLQLWEAFKRVPVADQDKLVGIHHAVMALASLRNEIQGAENSGKLAQAEIDATKAL